MKRSSRYATLKDVATLANTSVGTVSYVLSGNKERYVSKELRERILKIAEDLHYVRCAPASGLRGKPRGIIAVTVPQFTNIFFSRIILAIEKIMLDHGYILSICNTYDQAEREKNVLEIMMSQRFDGFILIPTENGYKNFESIRLLNLPYVVVERPLVDMDDEYDFVSVDNYSAGKLAAEHLVSHGHKRIGFIRWDSAVSNLEERLLAYQDVLRKYALPVDDTLVIGGEFSIKMGYELTKVLLSNQPDVTAIIYEENVMAQGGIQYLHEAGINIPEDISVVVIGCPEWVHSNNPSITSIAMPEDEIGSFAATTLLQRIENDTQPSYVHQKFPCWLSPGNSVKDIR